MNEDVLDRCEDLIQRGQYPITEKNKMWEVVTNQTLQLEKRRMALGSHFAKYPVLTAALRELLRLTEEPYLGRQLPE